MKKQALILIFILSLITVKMAGQCVTVGSSQTICQNGSTASLGGAFINSTTTAVWTSDVSSSVFSDANALDATWTPPVGFSGTATLTLTATDGCSETIKSTNLIILVTPTVGNPSTPSGSTSICQGSGSTSYTTSASDATSYAWTVSGTGNTISGTGTTGTVTWDPAFSGPATVSVTASGCGTSTIVSSFVTINSLPVAGLTSSDGDNVICTGQSVTFSATGGASYEFFVAGVSQGAATSTSTFTTTTLTNGQLVTVKVFNGAGCSDTHAGIVTTVNALPSVTFTAQPGTTSICSETDVTYSTQSGKSDYIWSGFGSPDIDYSITSGGLSSTDNTVTLKWLTSGTKTVTINYTSSFGCTAVSPTSSQNTPVNPIPGNPLFTAGSLAECYNSSDEKYTATSESSTSISYSVSPSGFGTGGAGTINSGTGVMAWKNTFYGTATITATASNACGTSSTSEIVTVYPDFLSTPTSITGSSSVCQGQVGVSYSISAISYATNYVWTVPSGATFTGQGTTSIIVDFTSSLSGNITVHALNSCVTGSNRSMAVAVRSTPTADISGSSNACQSESKLITFTNNMSESITVTYNINGGDPLTKNIGAGPSSTATISAQTAVPGTYEYNLVSAVYQSGATCPNSFSGKKVTMVVTPTVGTPTAITISAGTEPACQVTGSPTTTYSTTATDNTSYTWSLSTSSAGSINSSGVMSWTNGFAGNVDIGVKANGCNGPSLQVIRTVSVIGHPSAPAPTATTICQGSSNTSYTTSAASATTYTWSVSGSGNTISQGTATGSVTWDPGFSGNSVIQVFADGCPSATSSTTVFVRPTLAPGISGTTSVCKNGPQPVITLTNNQSSIGTVTITYSINGANQAPIDVATTATVNAPTVTAGTFNYSLVSAVYKSAPACSSIASGTAVVTVNPLPVPSISGTSVQRATSAGNVFTTEATMSNYLWSFTGGGTITAGGNTADNTITFTWPSSGAKTVSVNYADGNGCSATSPATFNVTVNPLPVASSVLIPSSAEEGNPLTGNFVYTDNGGYSQGSSIFKWYTNGTDLIAGATGISYTPTSGDVGKTITFEVTPVSTSPSPNAGLPVKSSPTSAVVSAGVPEASQVCTQGIRTVSQKLLGKYLYTYSKPEGVSTYRWLRNNVPIASATDIEYTLTAADTLNDVLITFEVTPKSTASPAIKTGLPVVSDPFARFTIPQDKYSVAVSEVVLTANPSGGVFSGPAVTNGTFSPSSAGIGLYILNYFKSIVNPAVTCSQQALKKITVESNTTQFGSVESVYCKNGGNDRIVVEGIPAGAIPYIYQDSYYDYGFYINGPYATTGNIGIVSEEITSTPYVDGITPQWAVTIDPTRLRVGTGVDVLYLYYYYGGYYYLLKQPLNVEAVATITRITNLKAAYCFGDATQNITVDGLSPAGGTATWTDGPGGILSNKDQLTAILNPSSGITGQTYNITYRYRTPNGCFSNILTQDVKINSLPDPAFTLNPTYNIEGGAVTLVETLQPGGSFVGNGVSGNKLFPDIAGPGNDIITYSITDANSCFSSSTKTTTIRQAQGTLAGLPSVICYRDTTYSVTATGLPAGVSINSFTNTKKSIIHAAGETSGAYSVTSAGAGFDTLNLSYKWSGVDYKIYKVINIDSLGQVEIRNLFAGDVICNNISPFELLTTIKGGVFTGPVTGGYLDPTKALGAATVSYKYTSLKTGCATYIDIPVTVISAPVISFAPADYCIENKLDLTTFINNTTSSGLITDWLWEFSDAAGSVTSTKKEPSYLYKTAGLHPVTLTVKTTNNCEVTKTISIDLGVKPVADFYWKKDCFNLNEPLELVDTTFSASSITSRTWNFFDGGPLLTGLNPTYPKKAAGYQKVQYIVNTNYANCSDTVTRNIYIRPSVTLGSDSYFQDFESGNGGWVKYEDTGNTWSFGKPDRIIINNAYSGNSAWYTNYTLVNQKVESSSIISPCFDFTATDRPMISLELWRQFDKDRDGAALQYKVKDEKNWHYIGTLDDGIKWYNSAVIKGKPGGEPLGWTTKDTKWVESRHTLDELKNKKDVKFRIAYGSDGTATDNDGIAFDNVWIGERSRKVLLEHFTNTSSITAKDATAIVNNIVSQKAEDVINIQYHSNFPGTDPFYNENPGDASARILFYGLTKVPYSFIDGGNIDSLFAKIYDYKLASLDSNDVARRSLVSPKFDISLTTDVTGGILTVSGKIKALEAVNADNLTLFISVTEKKNSNHTGANGETIFYYVFKKSVPDAGGISLNKSWAKGESYILSEKTWVIEKTLNSADIEVVAFIQNNVTKEVYQVASQLNPNITVGLENVFNAKADNFALYPNPAVNRLTILFEKPLAKDSEIVIYDIQGTRIRSYKILSGSAEFPIDNLDLKAGIYMISVTSNGINLGFKKLIVSGD